MRRLLPLLFLAAASVGCAASADEDAATTGDALSLQTLTDAACKTPKVTTKPSLEPGSATTNISGCIIGKQGESGKDVIGRAATLLGDTKRIGTVKAADGTKVFQAFTPGATTGTLATGLVQDVDVTLAMFGSPSSRLRVTRRLSADGVYSVHITNVTPFEASIAVFSVTAIETGNLSLDVQMKPEANGLDVTGTGSVLLEVKQDEAASASEIVGDLFGWLTSELHS